MAKGVFIVLVLSALCALGAGSLLPDGAVGVQTIEVTPEDHRGVQHLMQYAPGTDYHYWYRSSTSGVTGALVSMSARVTLRCACEVEGDSWLFDFLMANVTLSGANMDPQYAAGVERALSKHASSFVLGMTGEIVSLSFDVDETESTRAMKKTIMSLFQTCDTSLPEEDLAVPQEESDGASWFDASYSIQPQLQGDGVVITKTKSNIAHASDEADADAQRKANIDRNGKVQLFVDSSGMVSKITSHEDFVIEGGLGKTGAVDGGATKGTRKPRVFRKSHTSAPASMTVSASMVLAGAFESEVPSGFRAMQCSSGTALHHLQHGASPSEPLHVGGDTEGSNVTRPSRGRAEGKHGHKGHIGLAQSMVTHLKQLHEEHLSCNGSSTSGRLGANKCVPRELLPHEEAGFSLLQLVDPQEELRSALSASADLKEFFQQVDGQLSVVNTLQKQLRKVNALARKARLGKKTRSSTRKKNANRLAEAVLDELASFDFEGMTGEYTSALDAGAKLVGGSDHDGNSLELGKPFFDAATIDLATPKKDDKGGDLPAPIPEIVKLIALVADVSNAVNEVVLSAPGLPCQSLLDDPEEDMTVDPDAGSLEESKKKQKEKQKKKAAKIRKECKAMRKKYIKEWVKDLVSDDDAHRTALLLLEGHVSEALKATNFLKQAIRKLNKPLASTCIEEWGTWQTKWLKAINLDVFSKRWSMGFGKPSFLRLEVGAESVAHVGKDFAAGKIAFFVDISAFSKAARVLEFGMAPQASRTGGFDSDTLFGYVAAFGVKLKEFGKASGVVGAATVAAKMLAQKGAQKVITSRAISETMAEKASALMVSHRLGADGKSFLAAFVAAGSEVTVAPQGVRDSVGGSKLATPGVKAEAKATTFMDVVQAQIAVLDGLPDAATKLKDLRVGLVYMHEAMHRFMNPGHSRSPLVPIELELKGSGDGSGSPAAPRFAHKHHAHHHHGHHHNGGHGHASLLPDQLPHMAEEKVAFNPMSLLEEEEMEHELGLAAVYADLAAPMLSPIDTYVGSAKDAKAKETATLLRTSLEATLELFIPLKEYFGAVKSPKKFVSMVHSVMHGENEKLKGKALAVSGIVSTLNAAQETYMAFAPSTDLGGASQAVGNEIYSKTAGAKANEAKDKVTAKVKKVMHPSVFGRAAAAAKKLAPALTALAAKAGSNQAGVASAVKVVESGTASFEQLKEFIICTVGSSLSVSEAMIEAAPGGEMCKGQKEPLVELLKSKSPSKDAKCTAYMGKIPLLHPEESVSKDTVAVMKELLVYFDKVPELMIVGCDLGNQIPALASEFHGLVTQGGEDTNFALDNIQERWNLVVNPYADVMAGLLKALDAGGVQNRNMVMLALKSMDKTTRMLRALMNGKLGMLTRAVVWVNAGQNMETTSGDCPPQLKCSGGEGARWAYKYFYSTEFSLFSVPIPFVVFGMPVTVTISGASAPFFSAQYQDCESTHAVIGVGKYHTVGLVADLETVLSVVVTVGPPGLNVGLGLEIEVLNLGLVWQLDMSLEKLASATRVGPYIGSLAGWVDAQLTIGPWSWARKIFLWSGFVKELNALCYTSNKDAFDVCGRALAPPSFNLDPDFVHPAGPVARPPPSTSKASTDICQACYLKRTLAGAGCSVMHCELTPQRMARLAGMPNMLQSIDYWLQSSGIVQCVTATDVGVNMLLGADVGVVTRNDISSMQICAESLDLGPNNVRSYKSTVGIKWVKEEREDTWLNAKLAMDKSSNWQQKWTTEFLGGFLPKKALEQEEANFKVVLGAGVTPGSTELTDFFGGKNYLFGTRKVPPEVEDAFYLNDVLSDAGEVHLDSDPYPGAITHTKETPGHSMVYKTALVQHKQQGYGVGEVTENAESKAVSLPFRKEYSHSRIQVNVGASSCLDGDEKPAGEEGGAKCPEIFRYYSIQVTLADSTCWTIGRSFPEIKEWYAKVLAELPKAGLKAWDAWPVHEECSVYCNSERVRTRIKGFNDLLKETMTKLAGAGGKGTKSKWANSLLDLDEHLDSEGKPTYSGRCLYCPNAADDAKCSGPPLFTGTGLTATVSGVSPRLADKAKMPEALRFYDLEVSFPVEKRPHTYPVTGKNFEAWQDMYSALYAAKTPLLKSTRDVKVSTNTLKNYPVFEACSGYCNKERVNKREEAFGALLTLLLANKDVVKSPIFQKFLDVPYQLSQAQSMGGIDVEKALIVESGLKMEVPEVHPSMEEQSSLSERNRFYAIKITIPAKAGVYQEHSFVTTRHFPELKQWYNGMHEDELVPKPEDVTAAGYKVWESCKGWCNKQRVEDRKKALNALLPQMVKGEGEFSKLKSGIGAQRMQDFFGISYKLQVLGMAEKLKKIPNTEMLMGAVAGGPALTSTLGGNGTTAKVDPTSLGEEQEIVLATGQCFDCKLVGESSNRRLACPRLGLRRGFVFQMNRNGGAGAVDEKVAKKAMEGRKPLQALPAQVLDFGVGSCLKSSLDPEAYFKNVLPKKLMSRGGRKPKTPYVPKNGGAQDAGQKKEDFPATHYAKLAFNDQNEASVAVCDERGYSNGDYGGWVVVTASSGSTFFSFRIRGAFSGTQQAKLAEFSRENCFITDQTVVMPLLPSKRDKAVQDLHRKMQEEKGFRMATEQECVAEADLTPKTRQSFDDGFKKFITNDYPQLTNVISWEDSMPSDTCFKCVVDGDSLDCANSKQHKPLRRMALSLGDNTASIWKSSELQKIDKTILKKVLEYAAELVPDNAAFPLKEATAQGSHWGVCDERTYTSNETAAEVIYAGLACHHRGLQSNCIRYAIPYVLVARAAEMPDVEDDPLFTKPHPIMSEPLEPNKKGDEEYLYLWSKWRNGKNYDPKRTVAASKFAIKQRCSVKPEGSS